MIYSHLRIHRPETGTDVTIQAPFDIQDGPMSSEVAQQLNSYVDAHFPGFHISGFLEPGQVNA